MDRMRDRSSFPEVMFALTASARMPAVEMERANAAKRPILAAEGHWEESSVRHLAKM
jgi:hypothetical protein